MRTSRCHMLRCLRQWGCVALPACQWSNGTCACARFSTRCRWQRSHEKHKRSIVKHGFWMTWVECNEQRLLQCTFIHFGQALTSTSSKARIYVSFKRQRRLCSSSLAQSLCAYFFILLWDSKLLKHIELHSLGLSQSQIVALVLGSGISILESSQCQNVLQKVLDQS